MDSHLHMAMLLCLATLIPVAMAVKDISVCTDFTQPSTVKNTVQKPNISSQFHTRVEAVIVTKNQTTDFHEYFDSINNRGRITQTLGGATLDAWYSYKTNEYIAYDINKGKCTVTNLDNSLNKFLFGDEIINGQGHIFSAAGALHFGGPESRGVNEVYQGVTTVRGITVDWWRSCQYWKNLDATMVVDWYFTAQNVWNSAVGTRIPVRCHIQGKSSFGKAHPFEHYYEFIHFYPYPDEVNDPVFETPAGLTCPGRTDTRGFPKVPQSAFSFTTEILDLNADQLSYMTETFYYSEKLVKYEYRPQPFANSPYGSNDLLEVHDYHSGVAYITDLNHGNCSYKAIEANDFDDRSAGANTVRIRNSKEFFYFDNSHNVAYEGVKKNRDVDCDTWIATRSDFPFGSPTNSTWEWYFMTNSWYMAGSDTDKGAVPVQMRIKVPNYGWDYQYNLYNFKTNQPDLLKFDVSACYEFGQRRKFQFMLPGSAKADVSQDIDLFKYYVLIAITGNAGVSPIRVANLQLFFADTIIVSFEILDVSPQIGDTKRTSNYKEISLDFAANTMSQLIQNSQFIIPLGSTVFKTKGLVALPNSIVETTYINKTINQQQQTSTTGYGAGPMAAVGVSMPILGVGMGVVFAYFFFK